MLRVYVSGRADMALALESAAELARAGYSPYIAGRGLPPGCGLSSARLLEIDLDWLGRCDIALLLDNWNDSISVTSAAEVDEACRLGIPQFQSLEELLEFVSRGGRSDHVRAYSFARDPQVICD